MFSSPIWFSYSFCINGRKTKSIQNQSFSLKSVDNFGRYVTLFICESKGCVNTWMTIVDVVEDRG